MQKGFAACLHLSGPTGMDPVPVIGAQFLMQALGSMGQQVAVMNRAVRPWQVLTPEGGEGRLKTRHPITNHQFRAPQTTGIRILKEPSPGRSALPSPVADGEKHLLPITSYAHGAQHRDGGGCLVQDEAHLLLYPAAMGAGGWQKGRRGRSRRSGLQHAASPSVGKRASRSLDPRSPWPQAASLCATHQHR